ncbi:MAG: 50S ribosomal protein L6 [Candidatus Kerfeldbacteria bacterium CG15_BIG_FIL_POST_REV_8_21_14_020_45_12]|uniref:Large ribosomal subunit protein uL6 n=1 Tax=Candidatus Kerfeldbacteria bacterium CG15_BIG_FIL_POST_REV_8_21_14_020_45_12 TaxID=2014247 RepID=A0A2M7H3T7_9BACT|nr:MAG: 50S ribosomal protein L6 [Candidatus Kerfeldbacteria bacterium CG15_BIG_FIL_POST_REV_8_21_14_020_45_12]PJA93999.1 MAG: 50S ribosomal protein L6 [Candidatus Kerfeldbacteria bacterium CG_4_9_14_3_um_filter_45_8]
MSRIGKQPIAIPDKVTVEVKGGLIVVKGPKGELSESVHSCTTVTITEAGVEVAIADLSEKSQRSMWGTMAALIRNMIIGVTDGFTRKLEINGVGYGWQVSGKKLTVKAGYSHPIDVTLPEGIDASAEGNVLTISGINKQLVGEVAANIRKIRTPEPYKGSGIKYDDEQIRRKAGKQAGGDA